VSDLSVDDLLPPGDGAVERPDVAGPKAERRADGSGAASFGEVTGFGSNPGDLKMYKYVPASMPAAAPLLVALPGCSVDVTSYALASGWHALADAKKFYVAYAEQKSANNPVGCFNWFLPTDAQRDKGEALSIKQMVDKMKAVHGVDAKRVFVTGLSAGGAMSVNLLADYPELFAGGAIMSGIPFGCADSASAGYSCMSGVTRTAKVWGDLVRAQSPGGPYPRVVLFQGSADSTVAPSNLDELVKQWTDVHGADQTPDTQATLGGHAVKGYSASGKEVVRSYLITGMDHGIAVDPGSGPTQGGKATGFSFAAGLWSSYYAAQFFSL
jgi:poly(hydroxyalkanoate) depolymerase family esterase